MTKTRGGARPQPKNPRGPQFRTQIMDKRYIALLTHHGRSTATELQPHTAESALTTLRRLGRLRKSGDIVGEKVGTEWVFWTV